MAKKPAGGAAAQLDRETVPDTPEAATPALTYEDPNEPVVDTTLDEPVDAVADETPNVSRERIDAAGDLDSDGAVAVLGDGRVVTTVVLDGNGAIVTDPDNEKPVTYALDEFGRQFGPGVHI